MISLKNTTLGLIFLPLLFSCQSNNTISIEEAEKVLLNFNKVQFIPPPRSIGDLEQSLPIAQFAPTENLAPRCANVESDGKWVNRFKNYLKKYKPNDRIDTNIDEIGNWDLRRGWELYRGISIMEIRRGNLKQAAQYQKQYLDKIPDSHKGANVPGYAQLSIIYTAIGNLSKAQSALREAESWNAKAQRRRADKVINHDSWLARARGDLALAKGDLKDAEQQYKKTFAKKRQYKASSSEVAISQSLVAKVLAQQNRLLEAENEIRQAISHSSQYNRLDKASHAPIIYRLAEILLLQNRYKESQHVAESAVWSYQNGCIPTSSIEFALARQTLAYSLSRQNKHSDVLSLFKTIEQSLGTKNKTYQIRFQNDLVWSYALIKTQQANKAIKKLTDGLKTSQQLYGKEHPKTAVNLGYLAMAELESGQAELARNHFDQAVTTLLKPQTRNFVSTHDRLLIFEAYLNLLTTEAQQGNQNAIAVMFKLTEALRDSSVQEAVAAMGSRASVKDPELAKLLRREQDARLRLKSLEITLVNAQSSGADTQSLQEQVDSLRKAHASVSQTIDSQYSNYANMLQPGQIDVKSLSAQLQLDESLVVTYVGENRSYVWAFSSGKPIQFHSINISKQNINETVQHLMSAMDPTGDQLEDIPVYDLNRAYELYKQFLKPVDSNWKYSSHILLVAHGPLGHLPFAILPTQKSSVNLKQLPMFSGYRHIPWLIKSHSISIFPSASSLLAMRKPEQAGKPQEEQDQRNEFIGFGNPWFNKEQMQSEMKPQMLTSHGVNNINYHASIKTRSMNSATLAQLPGLPETEVELKNIATILNSNPAHSVFTGSLANEEFIKKKDLFNYKIITFATHGLIPGDLDGLTQPALALTAPDVAGVPGDGLLTMDEIMNLRLNADWVILSACNTATGEGDNAEAVSGLGRAFFYAGVRSLLVSNWSVESQSSKLLTTGIFKNGSRAENSRAGALRASMLHLLEKGEVKDPTSEKIVFSYAHPIFWAPFSLVGETR